MNLSNIIFYKNLGIPLNQIQTMEHSTPEEHEFLFYQKIEELKLHPFTETDIDTDCSVGVQHSDNIQTEHRGLTVPIKFVEIIP